MVVAPDGGSRRCDPSWVQRRISPWSDPCRRRCWPHACRVDPDISNLDSLSTSRCFVVPC